MHPPSVVRKSASRMLCSGKFRRTRHTAVRAKQSTVVEQRVEALKSVNVVPSGDKGVPGWQQLVALSGLVAVICSVDRASISVAILPMSAQYLWDDGTKGLISSAFFVGYDLAMFFLLNVCRMVRDETPGSYLELALCITSIAFLQCSAAQCRYRACKRRHTHMCRLSSLSSAM